MCGLSYLRHGVYDFRELLLGQIMEVDPADFCCESRVQFLDRDGLELVLLNKSRHVAIVNDVVASLFCSME